MAPLCGPGAAGPADHVIVVGGTHGRRRRNHGTCARDPATVRGGGGTLGPHCDTTIRCRSGGGRASGCRAVGGQADTLPGVAGGRLGRAVGRWAGEHVASDSRRGGGAGRPPIWPQLLELELPATPSLTPAACGSVLSWRSLERVLPVHPCAEPRLSAGLGRAGMQRRAGTLEGARLARGERVVLCLPTCASASLCTRAQVWDAGRSCAHTARGRGC